MAEISFGTYEPSESENPYLQVVKEWAADVENGNPNKTLVLKTPYADAQKDQFKVQRAANLVGHTAKLKKDESAVKVVGKDEDGNDVHEGDVILTFRLTEMHKPRRGKRVVTKDSSTNSSNDNSADSQPDNGSVEVENVTPIDEKKDESPKPRSNAGRSRA
jgi:hypothetical protein